MPMNWDVTEVKVQGDVRCGFGSMMGWKAW